MGLLTPTMEELMSDFSADARRMERERQLQQEVRRQQEEVRRFTTEVVFALAKLAELADAQLTEQRITNDLLRSLAASRPPGSAT